MAQHSATREWLVECHPRMSFLARAHPTVARRAPERDIPSDALCASREMSHTHSILRGKVSYTLR